MDYKAAGVDVEAGYKAVELMKEHVKSTRTEGVVDEIGGFGGLFSLAKHSMEEPVLVSGTDGVGTKLKVAIELDQHDTIGIDCVAMCVNDIICAGATPLFFLDYIACGKNYPEQIATIVSGIADGCRQSGAALVGGETAEMPGFYQEGDYDMAGFCVGIVDKKDIIDGSRLEAGDTLIGLPSSGIHSNGYSLVKAFEINQQQLSVEIESLGTTLGKALIEPTKIYVKAIEALKSQVTIKAISHVTGGGFIENIPRMLKEGTRAVINKGTWPVLPIFELMKQVGNLEEMSMYNTFNMGIGMVIAVSSDEADQVIMTLDSMGEKAYKIGEIVAGEKGLDLC